MMNKKEMIFNCIGIGIMMALVFTFIDMIVFVCAGIIAGIIATAILGFLEGVIFVDLIHDLVL